MAGHPPGEFVDLMADWMIEHGPDGHCDGHEIIAKLAWDYFVGRHPLPPQTCDCGREMTRIELCPVCDRDE